MLSKNQVREIRALHLKKYREAQKLFIAEGTKTVAEILTQQPGIIRTIYAQPGFFEKYNGLIDGSKIRTVEVNEVELRSISLQTSPNLVLAVCEQLEVSQPAVSEAAFCFYLDDIRDPGNFGTIIRLCDWFGSHELFASRNSCELYNPKVIQSSMGAFLRVKVHYQDLGDVLQSNRFRQVYGAVLNGADLYRENVSTGLIIIGNEANGIAPENIRHITRPLTIPAHGGNGSESLNAAMATAILAAEFFRQTRK